MFEKVSEMGRKFLAVLSIAVFIGGSKSFAGLTDDLIRRGGNAAAQLAQGNTQGALYETVPYSSYGSYIPVTKQTSLNAGLGGTYLKQGLIPFSTLNTKYLNLGANYNVGSAFNFGGSPYLSQNVQMSASNPYFSNTTVFTPKLGRKWS